MKNTMKSAMAKKVYKKEKSVIDTRNIEIKVSKKGAGKSKENAKKLVFFLIKVVIVLALIYILTSARKVTVTEEKNITIPQTKVVQEPYQVVEEYQEKVPYGTQFCVNRPMNFTFSEIEKSVGSRNNTLVCSANLTNLEDVEGTWIYDAYLETFMGNAETPEVTKTVDPHSTVAFSFEIELPPKAVGGNCVIFAKTLPSMVKCYYPEPVTYRLVTKTRTVTKYRDVTKTEEMTSTNVTTSTKFVNKVFGYEQGFYFGW